MIKMIKDGTLIEVELAHPDTSSEWFEVYVESPYPWASTEEWDTWEKETFFAIWKQFNAGHYYHELILTSVYHFDDKVVRHKWKKTTPYEWD